MEQMFSIPDGYFTTLAFDDDGRAYVGTGSEGRVYRVAPDRTAALAIDVPERQALALLRAGKGFLVGTGDVGGVYRAEPAAPRSRRPTCRACSTASSARAGACSAGTARTGSRSRAARATPPSPTPPGRASRRSSGRAPPRRAAWARSRARPARYVQYRVTFDAPEARLGAVTLAYLPQNQRARITELGTADSGGARARDRRAGGAGGERARRRRPRARAPDRAQAALEGGEPRRRRADLPARVPRGERSGLAPAGRPRPADQDRVRLEHRGAARRQLRRARSPPATSVPSRASARWRRRSRRRRSWSTTASPRCVGLAAKLPVRVGPRARRPEPAVGDGVRDRRRRLADAGAHRRHLRRPGRGVHDQAAARWRPGRTRSPCASGTARTTSAPPAITVKAPANDAAAGGATTPSGCRPRPRSCRSRSGCCRTSARSCTARRRARRRSSIRPGRSTGCCARRSGCSLRVELALITHTHNDHIEGVDELVREDGRRGGRQPARGRRGARRRARTLIDAVDGGDIAIGRRGVRALETPGHTVGGTCYLADGYIVTGDVLFVGGCGRTDFQGGDTRRDVAQPAAADAPARGDARLSGARLRRDADVDDRARDADEPLPALRDVRGVPRPARAQAERPERRTCASARGGADRRLRTADRLPGRRDPVRQHPRLHDGDAARARLRAGRSASPPRTSGSIGGSYTAAAAVAGIVAAPLPRSLRPAQGAGRRDVRAGDRHRGGRAGARPRLAGAGARDRGRVRRPGDVDRAVDHRRRRPARAARPGDGRRDGRVLGRRRCSACRWALQLARFGGWRLPFIAVAGMGVVVGVLAAARDAAACAGTSRQPRPRRPRAHARAAGSTAPSAWRW